MEEVFIFIAIAIDILLYVSIDIAIDTLLEC